jgi:hypothetical protein
VHVDLLSERRRDRRLASRPTVSHGRIAACHENDGPSAAAAGLVQRGRWSAGAGYLVTSFANELPGRVAVVLFASTREWADKNRDVAERVRTALAEGAKFVNANRDKAVDLIVKYTKVPREIVAKGTMVLADTDIEPAYSPQRWWDLAFVGPPPYHARRNVEPCRGRRPKCRRSRMWTGFKRRISAACRGPMRCWT